MRHQSPITRLVVAAVALAAAPPALAESAASFWPGFRGPGGLGVATEGCRPPTEFGPQKNVLWKTDLPPGHSSPVVAAGRVYLTAAENNQLTTLCLNASDGKVLWKQHAPAPKLEKTHPSGSPASSTPVTDGQRVFVYFGSYGLLAYDSGGESLWTYPLPTPKSMYGTATSPLLAGNNVILLCDSDAGDSYLLAVDKQTGKPAWKAQRALFRGSWTTPLLWPHDGTQELVVLGSGRVVAYDPADGSQRWSVAGFPPQVIGSPVLGDGLLFAARGGLGDPGESFVNEIPKWDVLLKEYDKNNDGKLAPDEVPADYGFQQRKEVSKDAPGNFLALRTLLKMVDGNKDGAVSRFEWTLAQGMLGGNEDVVLAIRPGGTGDVTRTHVAWKQRRAVPEIPSPLFYAGRLYLVKNGGIVSCLDPATGKTVYRERLGAGGQYAASPVAADGRIYAASEAGVVTVFKAGDELKVLAENDLAERTMASPAIVGGTLYVRTEKHVYAFAAPQ